MSLVVSPPAQAWKLTAYLVTYFYCLTGIAVRSGHLCCQPLHAALGVSSSLRASLYIYNTPAEVDVFVRELKDAINFFK